MPSLADVAITIKNALRGQKLGKNKGQGHQIFTPN